MKFTLYMHGGSGNHGCEALVRTTSMLIRKNEKSNILLWSGAKYEEYRYGINQIVDKIVEEDELNKKSISSINTYFKYKMLGDSKAFHNSFLKNTFKKRIAISIGGDNYCYPWSAKQGVELDREIRKYCYKNVFWGCSIEEEFLSPDVIKDLKGFDLITVRESFSYEILKKHGIKAEMVSDPAFLLNEKRLPLPEGFIEGNTVGINLSPLISDYESADNKAYKNFENLIKFILDKTDMSVCLIPHVVWRMTDDRKPLKKLFDKFKDSNRVVLIDDRNCEEIKGYISRCRFFVGARTHATIAAYSTCVPTLVMGYSIKAKGIAKDLFGTYEKYVLPVQQLKTDDEIIEGFKFIVENEDKIKNHLAEIIPEYKKKALYGGELLKSF